MKNWPSIAPFGKCISIPGGDLFYYDSGNSAPDSGAADKPALVLIHGLGDEADTWRHVFPILAAAGYRVIAPDLPGFGRSVWKGKIGVNCHSDAILRLISMTGAAESGHPAVLAGSSMGAGISEMAAFKRPDLIKGLILIDGCFPFKGGIGKGFYLLGLPHIGEKWYRGFRKNHEAAWKSLYPYYRDLDAMNTEDRDFLRERVIARVESTDQEHGYLSTMRSMNVFFLFWKQRMIRKIKSYPGKISFLWGEEDGVLSPDKADLVRSIRPDAELVFIPGAGHLPQQEKPEFCAEQMLRILKED